MFYHRPDGKKAKDLDPFFKLIPYIMTKRSESQIFYKQNISLNKLNQYIKEKRQIGKNVSYMTIILACAIRVFYERPKLNRFIMNGRIYEREKITIAFVVKKTLSDNSDESIIKVHFTGDEDIFQISDKINDEIKSMKKRVPIGSAEALAKKFMALPHFIVKWTVNVFKWLDKYNCLPKSIIEASPFHSSLFLTNVKSIKLNYLYHHLYDFGTTSAFIALGNNNAVPAYNDEQDLLELEEIITLGYTLDERICDGLYLSNSLRAMEHYILHPELLEITAVKIA